MVLGGFLWGFVTALFDVDIPETIRKKISAATIVAGINQTRHRIGEP